MKNVDSFVDVFQLLIHCSIQSDSKHNLFSSFKSFPTHSAEVLPDRSICQAAQLLSTSPSPSVNPAAPSVYTNCLPTTWRKLQNVKADVTAVCWYIQHCICTVTLGKHTRTSRRAQNWESNWECFARLRACVSVLTKVLMITLGVFCSIGLTRKLQSNRVCY